MALYRYPASHLTRWVFHCLFPVVLIVLQPADSRAQEIPAASVQTQYDALIVDGVREYRLRNFSESRALFTRANALIPNARALRGIGMAEYELRNYPACVAMLRAALASPTQALTSELRADAEAMLADSERYIGHFTLDVRPAAFTLMVDGVVVDKTLAAPLQLTVGDHLVEVQASGHLAARKALKVIGGEYETLHFLLVREQPAPAVSTPQTAPIAKPAKRPLLKNPWLWSGVGVAAAGLAIGLGVGLTRDGATTLPPKVPNPVAIERGP